MRTWVRKDCVTFRRTKDEWGGFSNMAGGYPIVLNGLSFKSSEVLYQACRYPDHPEIQKRIIEAKSPMAAKYESLPDRPTLCRKDFDNIRTDVMMWAVSMKLGQNLSTFGPLLDKTCDMDIVEDVGKRQDSFWGAIPSEDDTVLVGQNWLGVILMGIRRAYRAGRFKPGIIIRWPSAIERGFLYGEPFQEYVIG